MPAESHDFNGGFQTRVVPVAAPQHCGQDGRVAEADSCQGVRVKTNFRLRGGDGEAVSMGAISNKILKLRDEELWIAVRNGHVMGIDAGELPPVRMCTLDCSTVWWQVSQSEGCSKCRRDFLFTRLRNLPDPSVNGSFIQCRS